MAVLAGLGFSAGLPLMLVGQTLAAWMTDEGVDLKKIAAFASVGLPYTFKFLWAPLLDRYRLPFLGRRRGWMLAIQLALVIAITAMGLVNPAREPFALALCALFVAFFAASQDIVLDAYRTDLLPAEERAAGTAIYVVGFRVAMLVTGTLALVLADHIAWRAIYALMAALMVVGLVATLFAEEPGGDRARRPATLLAAFGLPLRRFFQRFGLSGFGLVVLFAMTYKFGDFLVDTLKMTFYKREIGFTNTEIGTLTKAYSFAAVALGGVMVGVLAPRLGVRRSLFVFGAFAAATNVLYLLMIASGKSYLTLGIALFFDHFAGAMGATVFIAFLMSLCDVEVSATQYALLTSLSSVGGRVFGWVGADLVAGIGWDGFFVATALMAIPGLLLIPLLPIRETPALAPVPEPEGDDERGQARD